MNIKNVLFIFDYITNRLPQSFAGTFQINRDNIDLRPTRQSDMMHVARCPLQFARRLSLYALQEIWNKQSRSIINVNNVSRFQFKNRIKATHLNTYQNQVRCMNEDA